MNAYICNLSSDALLHIQGPDALKFLQGQTTCNTDKLDNTHALLGAYCNVQGRVVCDFLLAALGPDHHYGLRMRRSIVAHSKTVFGKYIIFSKAKLDDDQSKWKVFGIWGTDARAALTEVFPAVPEAPLGTVRGEGYTLVQTDSQAQRFELFVASEQQAELIAALTHKLEQSDEAQWQRGEIASGIARIEQETIEEFIPQMVNYDITGHVNFNKGCYTGQEVVARMHYRGTSKRRMFIASLSADLTAAPGTPIFSAGEQSIGNVVNSVSAQGQATVALIVATVDMPPEGLHLGAIDGARLTLGELPYTLEKPGKKASS